MKNEHLPVVYKKVIFSHNKNMNKGEYLIDDRLKNGSEKFAGELIQFGTEKYKDWNVVLKYFEEVFIKNEHGG